MDDVGNGAPVVVVTLILSLSIHVRRYWKTGQVVLGREMTLTALKCGHVIDWTRISVRASHLPPLVLPLR